MFHPILAKQKIYGFFNSTEMWIVNPDPNYFFVGKFRIILSVQLTEKKITASLMIEKKKVVVAKVGMAAVTNTRTDIRMAALIIQFTSEKYFNHD